MKQYFIFLFALLIFSKASKAQLKIDSSFAINGCTSNAAIDNAAGLTVQPDGKILVTGGVSSDFMRIYRFKTNGMADSSFGVNGMASTPNLMFAFNYIKQGIWSNSINSVSAVVQPDNSIIVSGSYTFCGLISCGSYMPLLAKFTAGGKLDSTFGINGIVVPLHNFLANSLYFAAFSMMRPAGGGKLLVSGSEGLNIFMARLNADGSFDNSFATNGVCNLPKYATNDTFLNLIKDFKVDGSGNIFTTGDYYSGVGTSSTAFRGAYVVKIKPTGFLDASFGFNGYRSLTFNYASWSGALGIRNDNKIVVTGDTYDSAWAMQSVCWVSLLEPNGNISSTMPAQGYITINKADYNYGIAVVPDAAYGALLAMKTENNNDPNFISYIVSLSKEGKVDTTVNTKGFLKLTIGNMVSNTPSALVTIPGNKVLIAGAMSTSNSTKPVMLMQLKNANHTAVPLISQTGSNITFSVFPNPIKGNGLCSITLPAAGRVMMNLYAMDGKLVKTLFNDHLKEGNTTFPINLISLLPKVYYMEAETEQGERLYQKIIVD